MHLLDRHALQMSPNQALLTLYADYIGGQHTNYHKWYSAAQLDLDNAVGHTVLKTQAFSASALSMAEAATVPKNP
jgi:hypothetical protein